MSQYKRRKLDGNAAIQDESTSGCYQVTFKTQLKNLSHVVTFQSLYPMSSTQELPCPIGYYEVKIMSLECKDPSNFGVGLAPENYQMLKNVGSDKSIALRGNAKICYLSREERVSLAG